MTRLTFAKTSLLVGAVLAGLPLSGAGSDLPSHFDARALVKPITELEGVLSDGTKATVYKIVVRSLPYDHAMGPWAPRTLKDKGGYWEDTVDKKLHQVDAEYLRLLNGRGWNMFDADGTVHRTKNREEFDKVARQELGGWTYEQALKEGVTNSVIELQPAEQVVTVFLPKDPKPTAKVTPLRQARFSPRSGLGISTNGVRFFPPEPLDRITAFKNIAPLDPKGGHTGFGHEYHYHRAPSVMDSDRSGKVVGFALDGFPVRGPTESDGAKPKNLDTIGGHEHDGLGYHYHVSDAWPYIVGGFKGALGTAVLGDADVCDATRTGGAGGKGGPKGGKGKSPPAK
ncbi:MAG: hypothetical protein RL646_1380 [Verrucomicrobiota bacterium]|jgi:hypothetical protein